MNDSAAAPPMTPALRRQLQQCFERGSALTEQKGYDFDHAHALFVECVAKDPGNLVYVEAFLKNLERKYGNNKTGAAIKLFGGRGAFKKAVAREDWNEVLRLGPNLLKINPWDAAALRALADACCVLGHHQVELRYLRNAQEGHPDDPEVNRHCAQALTRAGRFDDAIGCWRRVQAFGKYELEAGTAISQLMTVKKAKEPTDDEPPYDPAPNDDPKKKPRIPLTRRQQLEQAILQRPGNAEGYFELADHLIEEDRFFDALRVLEKALAATGDELEVRERIEDASILEAVHKAQVAERRAEKELSQEAFLLAERLRDEVNRMELDVYNRRSERHPQNLGYKLKLGVCLKRAEKFAEAIEFLREASGRDDLLPRATLEMGECRQHQRDYAEALKCYRAALEAAESRGQSEFFKLALYRAGVLAAGLREFETAAGFYRRLVQVDPGFKDTSDRLDKIEEIRDKD